VGHNTLGEGWGPVEEMRVGWEVWSRPTVRIEKVGRGKCLNYAWSRGFGKVWGWDLFIHVKGWRLEGALVGGVWFVRIKGVINGWFVVCMRMRWRIGRWCRMVRWMGDENYEVRWDEITWGHGTFGVSLIIFHNKNPCQLLILLPTYNIL